MWHCWLPSRTVMQRSIRLFTERGPRMREANEMMRPNRNFLTLNRIETMSVPLGRLVLLVALLVPFCAVITRSQLQASTNTITVTDLGDPGTSGDSHCTLREAINNANSPAVDTTGGD